MMNHSSPSAHHGKSVLAAVVLMGLISGQPLRAEVRLPNVISDRMVLQRDVPVRLWGWAESGEEVTVTFDQYRATVVTGKDRRWEVRLPALRAGGPYELTVAGTNTLRVRDVLVGEVWFCSGQSTWATMRTWSPGRDASISFRSPLTNASRPPATA